MSPDPSKPLLHQLGWAAQEAGCCGASCKEDCQRPPCPCNFDAWTPAERVQLKIEARKKRAA